ncbi:MAG: hypothetical protein ABH870_07525 [bacterium]
MKKVAIIASFLCLLLVNSAGAEEGIQISCDKASYSNYSFNRFFSRVVIQNAYHHREKSYGLYPYGYNIFIPIKSGIVSWIDRFYVWFVVPAAISGIVLYVLWDMKTVLRRKEE